MFGRRLQILFAAIVLALLLLSLVARAQVPTPLILRLDRDLKIIVTYPLEVKYGSTVRVFFDITAMNNVSFCNISVRFVLVHEGGSAVLYDRLIVENKMLQAGQQIQVEISFPATVPQPRPPIDPFLELYITVDYVANNKTKSFEYKSAPILVPRTTYAELSSTLANIQQKAALADELAKRVKELELKLADESGKNAVLSEQLKSLSSDWSILKEKIGGLQAENSVLKTRVMELENENYKLQQELASLREEKGNLYSKLTSTQSVYSTTLTEFANLRNKYESLSAEVTTLKIALAVVASTAVALAIALVLLLYRKRKLHSQTSHSQPAQQIPIDDEV